jgi:hypothetical protein
MVVTPNGYGSVSGNASERVPLKVKLEEQLSVAVGLTSVTLAVHSPRTIVTTIGAGQVMIGAVIS